jgi:hypothetical protein
MRILRNRRRVSVAKIEGIVSRVVGERVGGMQISGHPNGCMLSKIW